jgi:hypothetical protein
LRLFPADNFFVLKKERVPWGIPDSNDLYIFTTVHKTDANTFKNYQTVDDLEEG